jgi:hypothetical protein
MLTVITGPAKSGRTALASWVSRQMEEAGKHVLVVSDEAFSIERWFPSVHRPEIITPEQLYGKAPWPAQTPVLATFDAVVLDLSQLEAPLMEAVLRMDTTRIEVCLVVLAGRSSALGTNRVVVPRLQSTGGGTEEVRLLPVLADRAGRIFSAHRVPSGSLIELTAHKLAGVHQDTKIPLRFNIHATFTIEEA